LICLDPWLILECKGSVIDEGMIENGRPYAVRELGGFSDGVGSRGRTGEGETRRQGEEEWMNPFWLWLVHEIPKGRKAHAKAQRRKRKIGGFA
jgi:hypothetical protein